MKKILVDIVVSLVITALTEILLNKYFRKTENILDEKTI